jgi:hypothetical protein
LGTLPKDDRSSISVAERRVVFLSFPEFIFFCEGKFWEIFVVLLYLSFFFPLSILIPLSARPEDA